MERRTMTTLNRAQSRTLTLDRLVSIWELNGRFRDMRFGQLMVNLLSFAGRDPWFIPDEEWPEVLRQFGEEAAQPGTYRREVMYERPV